MRASPHVYNALRPHALSPPARRCPQYYKNFGDFGPRVDGCLSRIKGLLAKLPVSAAAAPPPPPAPPPPRGPSPSPYQGTPSGGVDPAVLDDPDDAQEWVSSYLDDLYERIDDSLAEGRAALRRKQQQAQRAGTLAVRGRAPGRPA